MTENNQEWDSQQLGKAAIIVGVKLPQDAEDSETSTLNELESLLKTLGVKTLGRITQKRPKLCAKSLVGQGKVDEIKEEVDLLCADMVVFERSLSGPQIRNLEKLFGVGVFDRTGIILEIFSRHARTSQAKTQVEIARLEYLLPRLSGAWTHFQRQTGGGIKSRGMGEKQLEVDRRQARLRISKLQQKLRHIDVECQTRRKARSSEWRVALVGYTNTGKTTLMHGLTRSIRQGEDELFATLDTQIKVLDPKTRPKILITDTVGLISNLPHKLIESFKSTLQEVVEADLLLHVIDLSHPHYSEQMATTQEVLAEIGADHIPVINVFNKVDSVEDKILPRVLKGVYNRCLVISANRKNDIEFLRDRVYDFFRQNLYEAHLVVPQEDHQGQSQVFANCLIIDSDYSDPNRVLFIVQATRPTLMKLKPFISKLVERRA